MKYILLNLVILLSSSFAFGAASTESTIESAIRLMQEISTKSEIFIPTLDTLTVDMHTDVNLQQANPRLSAYINLAKTGSTCYEKGKKHIEEMYSSSGVEIVKLLQDSLKVFTVYVVLKSQEGRIQEAVHFDLYLSKPLASGSRQSNCFFALEDKIVKKSFRSKIKNTYKVYFNEQGLVQRWSEIGSSRMSEPERDVVRICSVCSLPTTKICSKCQKIRFCSTECMKIAWNTHRPICKKLQKKAIQEDNSDNK
ncbi:MAG: hypothetical protein CMP11_08860 [Zetaproteobacteria bacterium]|nr:hypothetical protein [Pseudobdellovibrionaceae bacterium]|tara:strand:+ start:944 stop:1702 length:759 start_codon:yes stop_codon:yes gene_type:complete